MRGRGANGKEFSNRKRPKQLTKILPGDLGRGIRFFVFGAHLGKNLVEGYTRGERQSQFLLDRKSNGVGNFTSAAEQTLTGGYIEPGFIDTERLHQIRVAAVDFVDFGGVMAVFFHMRRHQNEFRAFASGLPKRFGSDDAVFFGGLVLRENNSMAAVRITADRHRHVAQFRTFQKFDGRKKPVHIAVQNDTILRDAGARI